jgi:hypothetical protein
MRRLATDCRITACLMSLSACRSWLASQAFRADPPCLRVFLQPPTFMVRMASCLLRAEI